jgi:Na+/glutamate symporter
LRRTGATEATLRFVAIGTIVRCVLGTPYARYLIGNYRVLPMGAMPVSWSRQIADIVSKEPF